ncbi:MULTISPECIES: DUF2790 domain-containing protein [Pseudomonadaceae]|jgi:Protein of unknown function (DUF2790)|uniref:DUF2790 domain-containing protein n=1 Tax=Stutzerimonas chloritidismutans AW-1 TaxID=1263865 RepID=V4PUM0_STUCH|nr:MULTISPECIES: DUF2790 domain-containing protein [Pseudomonadaceae]MBJ7545282.1 DUF2790 domain-containing protein [Pseudomonas sp. OA3]ESQ99900.1 hypothetical protein F753_08300 [Stutzerimonas chloritidismutans AW-1]MCL8047290.1 DUF2790 domain-containing protein [Pseudomonas aeruginosa]MCU9020109.1 DUF2790 domain-containing protein [Pseudomonas aeruginosa]MDI9738576.1 DUF2790 domain-containing protein [Stutzerimonas stutzeri]
MKVSKQVLASVITVVLVVAGGLAQAAQGQAIHIESQPQAGQVPVETYRYGLKLDIARVLSTSDTSHLCGVVPTVMHYENSRGEVRALEYLILGGGCFDH